MLWSDLALGDTPEVVTVVHCLVSTSSLKSSPDDEPPKKPPKDHNAPSEPVTILWCHLALGFPIDHGFRSGYLLQDRNLDAETLPTMKSNNTRETRAKDDTHVVFTARWSCFHVTPSEF
jgi:hypothetical protein